MQAKNYTTVEFDREEFGKRLKNWRKNKGLTQSAAAGELKTSTSYISAIERGEKKPSVDLLLQLYIRYPTDFGYIFLGEPIDYIKVNYILNEQDLNYEPDPERSHLIMIHLMNELNALQDENRKLEEIISHLHSIISGATKIIDAYWSEDA